MNRQEESVQLVYDDGWRSFKEYNVNLIENDGGWEVHCTYGKRYNANAQAKKTKSPVSYHEAKEIFDKVIAEKERKGYVKQ